MALYDYIKYKDKLYQTNSFNNLMESYEIKDNRLIKKMKSHQDFTSTACHEDTHFHGMLHIQNGTEGFTLRFINGVLEVEEKGS